MKYAWMEHIKTFEDFPEEFQPLAERIGVKHALEVMQEFAGQQVYFFKIKEGFSHIWHERIKKESHLKTLPQLAKEYDVSVQTVRNILNGDFVSDKKRQIGLFPQEKP